MPYKLIPSTPHFKAALAKTQKAHKICFISLIPDNLSKVCALTQEKADYKIVFFTSTKKVFSKYYSKAALKQVWDDLFEESLSMPVEVPDYESFEPDFK